MPLASIAAINLECPDPISLGRFWAHMLGGEITVETPGFCAVKVGTLHLGAVRDSCGPASPRPMIFGHLTCPISRAVHMASATWKDQRSLS
jgi:hypothetical protein